jgi:hypothetical protein
MKLLKQNKTKQKTKQKATKRNQNKTKQNETKTKTKQTNKRHTLSASATSIHGGNFQSTESGNLDVCFEILSKSLARPCLKERKLQLARLVKQLPQSQRPPM